MKNAVAFAVGALSLSSISCASIIIECSARAEVHFLNVEEIANGTPFGREGLQYQHHTGGVTYMTGEPPNQYISTASVLSTPRGGFDGRAPREGDGWTFGQSIYLELNVEGFGINLHQTVLDLSFLNITDGSSMYSLDVQIDWELTYRVVRADNGAETAVMLGIADGAGTIGRRTIFPGTLYTIRDAATPETTESLSRTLHMDIGRTQTDPMADSAHLQFTLTMQGYVSLIPAPGPMAVGGLGVLVAVSRRRREH